MSMPVTLTDQDVSALAYAIAATFKSIELGTLSQFDYPERVNRLLWYHLNPWNTEAAFQFLGAVSKRIDGMTHEHTEAH